MLKEMDTALQDEIQAQSKDKDFKHSAVNGFLQSEQNGHYLYQFTLESPWEPEDGAPLQIEINNFPTIKCSVVASNGITITIATEESLPKEALTKISLINDPTELLKKLREVLKNTNEGNLSLGSKSFGLPKPFSFKRSMRSLSPAISFGEFDPDESQKRAIQMALGSEVSYIIGPPGTGKTSTLAAIAFTHLLEGHTVLITAHTNIAVDNAIMKLADICRQTGHTKELAEGKILRYGIPQLKELREGNKYADVNISQVASRRASNLQEQKRMLETRLKPLITRHDTLIQSERDAKAKWQATYKQYIQQRNEYQRQLSILKESERLRIQPLQIQQHTLNNQITQTRQGVNITQQELTSLTSEKTTLLYGRNSYAAQVEALQSELMVAQQMSGMKRFFKRVNVNKIAQHLSEVSYQLAMADKAVDAMQQRIDALHTNRAMYEHHISQLVTNLQSIEHQMIPSSTIATLQTAIAEYTQVISFGPDGSQQISTASEQKRIQLEREIEQLQQQIASIDEQMKDLEEKFLAEARVVATTLSKTYMDSRLRGRRFDVVIIDEVSMAPLPAVYVVASQADQSVVALGDPHQLSPIVQAKTAAATRWLEKDLFAHNGISFSSAANQGYGNSAVLQAQSRIHPGISIIARKHVYNGGIIDSPRLNQRDVVHISPLPEKPLLLCDTSDANPIATIPEGGSRINIYHALCSIILARQALGSLPRPNASSQSNTERVGIVTPYRKQADLLRRLIKDAGLQCEVRAGTVHKFQGLEFEVVIFDTVETRPLHPIPDFTAGRHGSKAMRLVNVAVTRPKYKLIIVANAQYIYENLHDDDILYQAVQEAHRADVIQSITIIDTFSPSITRNISSTAPNQTLGTLRYELMPLSTAINTVGFQQSIGTTDAKPGELLGTIEDKIAYIAIDTAPTHTKSVLRVESPGLVRELTKTKKDKSKRETHALQKQNNLRYSEQPIRLASSILPPISPCKKCGSSMVARVRKVDGHPFYSCINKYSKGIECESTEQVSEIHLIHIPELTNRLCERCGASIQIIISNNELRTECAASTPCGFAQRIEFYKG